MGANSNNNIKLVWFDENINIGQNEKYLKQLKCLTNQTKE